MQLPTSASSDYILIEKLRRIIARLRGSGWQRGDCMDAVERRWRRTAEQSLYRSFRGNMCLYGELTLL